jgi:ribosomal protein S14
MMVAYLSAPIMSRDCFREYGRCHDVEQESGRPLRPRRIRTGTGKAHWKAREGKGERRVDGCNRAGRPPMHGSSRRIALVGVFG